MKPVFVLSAIAFAIVAACNGDLVIDNARTPTVPGDAGVEPGTGGRTAGGRGMKTNKDGGGGLAPAPDAPAAKGGAAGSSNEAGVTAGGGSTEGGAPREGGAPPNDDTCGVSVKIDSAGLPAEPSAIALDDSNVYWITAQGLRRVSKSGKHAVAIASDSVYGLAVDDTYVYWTGYPGDTLSRSPKTGAPAPVVLQQGFGSPGALVADAGTLYVVTNQGLARVANEVDAKPMILRTDVYSSTAIATDGTSIYFGTNQGQLVKRDKATGATVTLASANPKDIAVDETGVYFASRGGGSDTVIQRVSTTGGRVTTIARGIDNSFGMDSTAVYFVTRTASGYGALVGVPKRSGGAATLSSPVQLGASLSGHSIAADDAYVFYVDGENLMRYNKCIGRSYDAGANPTVRVDGGCPSTSTDGGVGAPSCAGLATSCGPCGNEDCCESPRVPGGTFYRTYNGPHLSDRGDPATVSDFRLDRFEITVGRFRRFISAWDAGYRPATGAGRHTQLSGGKGLAMNPLSFEEGWVDVWADGLPVATDGADGWDQRLSCDPGGTTWTSSPDVHESEPVRCLDWYAAYAFCIWDGGFLPSEAEWAYAATGGAEQRTFPWSSPPDSTEIDCAHANYMGRAGGTEYCVLPGIDRPSRVGWYSPLGDGKYGQADLAGNVVEWVLDSYSTYYDPGCVDCESRDLLQSSDRVLRGGGYDYYEFDLRATTRNSADPTTEVRGVGARCARAP